MTAGVVASLIIAVLALVASIVASAIAARASRTATTEARRAAERSAWFERYNAVSAQVLDPDPRVGRAGLAQLRVLVRSDVSRSDQELARALYLAEFTDGDLAELLVDIGGPPVAEPGGPSTRQAQVQDTDLSETTFQVRPEGDNERNAGEGGLT